MSQQQQPPLSNQLSQQPQAPLAPQDPMELSLPPATQAPQASLQYQLPVQPQPLVHQAPQPFTFQAPQPSHQYQLPVQPQAPQASHQYQLPVQPQPPLFDAIDLAELHHKHKWTKKHIQNDDEWDLLEEVSEQYPMMSSQQWATHANSVVRNNVGLRFVQYLDELATCEYQCNICKKSIYPTVEAAGGSVESCARIDHGTSPQGDSYLRGIICGVCNRNLSCFGDTSQDIMNNLLRYMAFVNNNANNLHAHGGIGNAGVQGMQ